MEKLFFPGQFGPRQPPRSLGFSPGGRKALGKRLGPREKDISTGIYMCSNPKIILSQVV